MSLSTDNNLSTEKLESQMANLPSHKISNSADSFQIENYGMPPVFRKEINFREMFESLSVMFYVENFDPVYELEYISPAFECLGYTLEEIYADPKILDLVMHPDDLLMMKEENKPIYDGTVKESNYSYRIFTKSGEMHWWKDHGRPIFNEKGERVKWFGVIYDITDRKKANEELIRTNEKLEQKTDELALSKSFVENILVSMADMLIIVNDDGIIQRINESALTMLGYEEAEMLGKAVRILTQKETFLSEDEFKMMLESGKLVEVEKDFVRKNGESFRVSISSSLLRGERAASVIVAKDITKRIEDEEKLREYADQLEQNNYEFEELMNSYAQKVEDLNASQIELTNAHSFTNNVLDSMVDFVVVVDMDLTIRRVNKATLRLNGFSERELIGHSINMLVADQPYNQKGVQILREKGFIHNLTKLSHCRDGSIIPISVSMCILKNEKGEECGIVCVGKDISEIVKARDEIEKSNERLRQSNRELQDFAYVASHDLQEPLRKVQAFGDRLERKYAETLGEEGRDYVSRMRNASARMQNLINDLLTFSRVSSKAQPFQLVDLKKICEEVASDLEIKIEQTGGHVEIGDLPEIDADPSQIRQLFQNLIGNALKFHRADENPVIKIHSKNYSLTGGSFFIEGEQIHTDGENSCEIIIEDNGIGFEEKYLDRIFTVFQRLHGRSQYEGSGIGLAVCRKIVERHAGHITASSQVGKGSEFLITLPVKQFGEERKENEN
ncbi:MAG: PAS domain S-box protein [Pyrinomonadaceae bacterium]